MTVKDARALAEETAEGVASCKAVSALGERHGVELPITRAVTGMIHEGREPQDVMDALMARAAKAEV
ncbi:hypothetical protein CF54_17645 [Streptomyces sp. Tu 6176]|nr:hypothetical protein CF54_17645 [Streptomyces sp. Tu 6176]